MKFLSVVGTLAALVSITAIPATLKAQPSAQQAGIADQLQDSRVDLRLRESGFEGEGWERILLDGQRAQFFVVGEQHGGAEIVGLAAAFHADLAKRGYTHAALEVGPYSTMEVERLIRAGPHALENYIRPPERGWLFPFLGWKEEVRLAEQYVRLSSAKQPLWGIDQEYVGSAPILIEMLSRRQKTQAQRAVIAKLAATAATNPQLVRDLKSFDLQPLISAFGKDDQALRIIEDYRLSGEIYAPFMVAGSNRYWANLTRENYMKSNFAAAFSQAEKEEGHPPKVFMKLGASHAMRGFSSTYVPSLGNFLSEWGVPRGFATLTVMIDCVADRPDAVCKPYFGTDHAIYKAATSEKYTMFDLRPLRARLRSLPELDSRSRDLIQSFDYYVLIRDVSRATPVRPRATSPRTNPTPVAKR